MIVLTKLMVATAVAASLALGSFSVESPEVVSAAGGPARFDSADGQDVALAHTLPCSSGCDFWTRLPSR